MTLTTELVLPKKEFQESEINEMVRKSQEFG